jgi:hypothetical protein
MNDREKKELLLVTSLVLAGWGVLLFFQSAYFGAFFYGVQPPWWTAWVASWPIWAFNTIDTVMVVVLLIAIVLAASTAHGRKRNARGGGAAGTVLILLGLLLFAAFLGAIGFNLGGLATDLQRFLGGLTVLRGSVAI